ncbi:MAG TPA: hypothetical protein VEB22_06510 [Phycisphaerales bacterium]|nr:hypothetical protein [Phycisphaerales bacterium]
MSTSDLLNQLQEHKRLPLLPHAQGDLAALQQRCGVPLPPQLAELYSLTAGATEVGDAYLRPLQVSEVLHAEEWFPPLLQRWGAVLCFGDDQSNYAGVYTIGPLTGMVFLLHHEEPSPCPRYWGLPDLLAAMLDGTAEQAMWGGETFGAQLPIAAGPASAEQESRASALADAMLAAAAAEPDEETGNELRKCALCLLPQARAADIRDMLRINDIWVPELAAKILGEMRDEAAIEELAWLAEQGRRNGDLAAIGAIGRIGGAGAQRTLVHLAQRPGAAAYALYLGNAMKNAGVVAERWGAEWFYRRAVDDAWRKIGG